MNRTIVATVTVVLAACGRRETRIESAADTAAAESGVPAELLLAIPHVESRATTDGLVSGSAWCDGAPRAGASQQLLPRHQWIIDPPAPVGAHWRS